MSKAFMDWIACPVCEAKNAPSTRRCGSCGADFDDPDVRAMAGANALAPPPAVAGALTSTRFLGFQTDGLVDGTALRKLALLGGVTAALGFVLPLTRDYHERAFAWQLVASGPAGALLFPAVAALLGFALSARRARRPQLAAAALTVAGLVGLVTLPWLGRYAGTAETLVPLELVGLVLSGSALTARLFRPHARDLRVALALGAALTLVGFVVPVGHAEDVLPVELRFYLAGPLGTAPPLRAWRSVLNRDILVFFTVAVAGLPVLLACLGAALAWPRPSGVWDRKSLALRLIAWFLVLAIPLVLADQVFNMTGWTQDGLVLIDHRVVTFLDFTEHALLGRTRLLILATGFALWAQLGLVALYLRRPA